STTTQMPTAQIPAPLFNKTPVYGQTASFPSVPTPNMRPNTATGPLTPFNYQPGSTPIKSSADPKPATTAITPSLGTTTDKPAAAVPTASAAVATVKPAAMVVPSTAAAPTSSMPVATIKPAAATVVVEPPKMPSTASSMPVPLGAQSVIAAGNPGPGGVRYIP